MSRSISVIGKTFGRLTVIGHDEYKKRYLVCRCICGNVISTFSGNLYRGLTKSCGCLNRELASKRQLQDLTGKQFGRLTVYGRSPNNSNNGQPRWICVCDCGATVEVGGSNLREGKVLSCGCLARELASVRTRKWFTDDELALTHVYHGMKQRCYDKNCGSYSSYGSRGITVCDEWKNNERAFVDWAISNGYKPGLTIERIDNNGPYAPWNCRLATKLEQANNRRTSKFITVDGVTHTLADWARIINVEYRVLWHVPDDEVVDYIRRSIPR